MYTDNDDELNIFHYIEVIKKHMSYIDIYISQIERIAKNLDKERNMFKHYIDMVSENTHSVSPKLTKDWDHVTSPLDVQLSDDFISSPIPLFKSISPVASNTTDESKYRADSSPLMNEHTKTNISINDSTPKSNNTPKQNILSPNLRINVPPVQLDPISPILTNNTSISHPVTPKESKSFSYRNSLQRNFNNKKSTLRSFNKKSISKNSHTMIHNSSNIFIPPSPPINNIPYDTSRVSRSSSTPISIEQHSRTSSQSQPNIQNIQNNDTFIVISPVSPSPSYDLFKVSNEKS